MGNLIPLTEQAHSNSGVAPVHVMADSGYTPADVLKSCPGVDHGARHQTLDPYRAAIMTLSACNVGGTRPTHRHRRPAAEVKRGAADSSRKFIVEPACVQGVTLQNGKQFQLRGRDCEFGRR